MLKNRIFSLVLAFLLAAVPVIFCSCGEVQPNGKYVSEEPYLLLNITDAENIIDFKGEMNLNGDDCDIIFSINKDSRHFEIKQDANVIYEGYYSTNDDASVLTLKTNETEFILNREE